MNSKFRITILFVLFAAEIAILGSLWAIGWEATVDAISWLGSVVLVTLPLLAIVVVVFMGGRRVSLASLFIVIALIAVFLAVVIVPLQTARNQRRGTIALASSGIGVITPSSYPNFATDCPNPLPKWLRPLSSDAIECPCDTEVSVLMLTTDLEVSRYCENAKHFPNLREIQLIGPNITSAGLKHLQAAQHLDKLESLIVGDSQFDENILERMPRLNHLWIYEQGFGTTKYPTLTSQQLTIIAEMEALKILTIQGYDVINQDIGILRQSTSLEQINFTNTKVATPDVDTLDSEMPNCVISHTPAE